MTFGEGPLVWQLWKCRFLAFLFLVSVLYLTLLPVWHWIGIQPILFLIILYHWTLYHPSLLAVEQLVLISLLQDGIYDYPLGLSALRLLLDYTLLNLMRRVLGHQGFAWVWGGFALFLMVDALVYTILLSCVNGQWIGILFLLPSVVMTVALYPLIVSFMNRFVMKRLSL